AARRALLELPEAELPIAVVHRAAVRAAPGVLGEVIEDAGLRRHGCANTTRSRRRLASAACNKVQSAPAAVRRDSTGARLRRRGGNKNMRSSSRWLIAGGEGEGFSFAGRLSAHQKVKIGFITTLSGPPAIIGKHMKDSVELALDHLKHRMGGLEVE